MDLAQRKLSQEEWESLEVPVGPEELRILKLIKDGYENVNTTYNDSLSLINFIKITDGGTEDHHHFLYDEYLKNAMNKLIKKHKIEIPKSKIKQKKSKLKKADIIRIKNTDNKIKEIRTNIFEFVVIDILEKFLKSKNDAKNKHFYTLTQLLRFKVSNFNIILYEKLNYIIDLFKDKFSKKKFIKNAYDYIERNNEIVQYKDIKLYDHQKELFTKCKEKGAKLLLYQAPTGTGKTLSPIGLVSGGKKVIFVCAAKHVGLQLAKACISLGIKIAVAFGCNDPGNIRLHWYAAKETIRNRRTGGIFKVDNSVGDNVEIMISDIQSYLPAMNYMRAFNKVEDTILYWDEPTITLDYETHEYHPVLSKNWSENEIPNVVLSSATLPQQDDLEEMISGFRAKFNSTNIETIVSHDCSKTIPILDSKGMVVLPHFIYDDHADIKKCVKHLKRYKTLLRHFDMREISKFIIYVNKRATLKDRHKLDNYFESIEDINVMAIKEYYLTLLTTLKKEYSGVFEHFAKKREPLYKEPIRITTADAYSLTDGPTIYLANDVEKIGKFCLKIAKIPDVMLTAILEDMGFNEGVRKELEKIDKDINKNKDKSPEEELKKSKGSLKGKSREDKKKSGTSPGDIKEQQLMNKYEGLRSQMKRIRIGLKFIPNTKEHLSEWSHSDALKAFTSSIDDEIVERIMMLEVDANWKVLLLMGIGVFAKHTNVDYVAIMKELALNQKLYLIIASTDYIYGTNYQFCHGYIGKDLANMSQEKMIQAIGRVGRSSTRQDYSIRLRSDNMIHTLFQKVEDNIEVRNMNKIFSWIEEDE
jgi:hypothetical protein